MPRCELTKKGPSVKNLVSHSNIKTKSRAFPNIQLRSLYSQALKRATSLKVAISAMRTIEHKGGLDPFLLKQPDDLLSKKARALKKEIRTKLKGFKGT